jgi:hypothetical protein
MTKITISSKELGALIPQSDAEIALSRIPREERLAMTKAQDKPLIIGDDCSEEIKDMIRRSGIPPEQES